MPAMIADVQNPNQRQFNPYTENGGTILAIAGADFSVIAGDTRQSEGYSIQTRYAPKVFRLYAVSLVLRSLRPWTHFCRQNGSCGVGRERLCCGRQHVREEGQTTTGGDHTLPIAFPPLIPPPSSPVVPTCPRKRHASAGDCQADSNNALRPPFLSLLRVQHSRRYRGRR
jgi:hypothetical protein